MATPLIITGTSNPAPYIPAQGIGTPAALLAAARAWTDSRPLAVAGPPGALEILGPGWPRALAAAFAAGWAETEPGRAPPDIALTLDCSAAVGLALAVLSDWPAPPGWMLTLALDPSVPPPAVDALMARAEAAHPGRVIVASYDHCPISRLSPA